MTMEVIAELLGLQHTGHPERSEGSAFDSIKRQSSVGKEFRSSRFMPWILDYAAYLNLDSANEAGLMLNTIHCHATVISTGVPAVWERNHLSFRPEFPPFGNGVEKSLCRPQSFLG